MSVGGSRPDRTRLLTGFLCVLALVAVLSKWPDFSPAEFLETAGVAGERGTACYWVPHDKSDVDYVLARKWLKKNVKSWYR